MNEIPTVETPRAGATERLKSLDAYRGLIMIALAFGGFGLAGTAGLRLEANPDSQFWKIIQHQLVHAQWAGCRCWDMIQPSFMFMVGVAMAYSYAKREKMGHSYARMLSHAIRRSIILVFIGVFITSNGRREIDWTFANVLCQIGLGYSFLFLLWRRSLRTQAVAASVLLVGTWLLYMTYPGAGIDVQAGSPSVGVPADWAQAHLADVGKAWHKNANVGHAVDLWLLNQFPRTEAFVYNAGGYPTINFIPSIATMLFGLMCGELLRLDLAGKGKIKTLVIAGVLGLAAGQLLHMAGICPIIKRIWTPSWAMFSTGWCCLILAALYAVVDVLKFHRWTFPLAVVGSNSIVMYCMSHELKSSVGAALRMYLGSGIFQIFGESWEPMVRSTLIGIIFWLICYWLYRCKMFVSV